jgi:integrin beta 2
MYTYRYVVDGHVVVLSGQFQCANTTTSPICLHPTQICDGNADCGAAGNNNSDEANCDTYECLKSQFKCPATSDSSAFCIAADRKCNKVRDCPGGEDEVDCPSSDCHPSQFRCSNGACVPEVW